MSISISFTPEDLSFQAQALREDCKKRLKWIGVMDCKALLRDFEYDYDKTLAYIISGQCDQDRKFRVL